MNKELEIFARDTLKERLAKCTEEQCFMFKRIYSHADHSKDINDVVDSMIIDDLDNAMQQVKRTLFKINYGGCNSIG